MAENWTTRLDWHAMATCLKLRCPVCGYQSNYSGQGALFIRCPSCRTIFELPTDVPLALVVDEPEIGVLDADTENVDI